MSRASRKQINEMIEAVKPILESAEWGRSVNFPLARKWDAAQDQSPDTGLVRNAFRSIGSRQVFNDTWENEVRPAYTLAIGNKLYFWPYLWTDYLFYCVDFSLIDFDSDGTIILTKKES